MTAMTNNTEHWPGFCEQFSEMLVQWSLELTRGIMPHLKQNMEI